MVGGNGQTTQYSGTLQDTGAALSLEKIGAGDLTLSGNNTYTGPTDVYGGLLEFSGVKAGLIGTQGYR